MRSHPFGEFWGGAWWVEMRLHVINGAFLGSPHFISLSTQTERGGLGMRVHCPQICIMVSITLTIGGGSWAGGTESVMWITRDWVGQVEVHQLRECIKLSISSKDFISLAFFSIRKCEIPAWCFMDSERLLPVVSFSLMRKQWYGTLLSLPTAVSREIQPWYHACPCSSAGRNCGCMIDKAWTSWYKECGCSYCGCRTSWYKECGCSYCSGRIFTIRILDVVIAKLCIPLENRTQSFGNSPRLPLSTPSHQPLFSLCW